MIKFVTANIASGIREAINLAERLAITTFGADSHTIRIIGGVLLRSAFSRSRHLGLGSLVPWRIAVSTEFMLCNLTFRRIMKGLCIQRRCNGRMKTGGTLMLYLEQTRPWKTPCR